MVQSEIIFLKRIDYEDKVIKLYVQNRYVYQFKCITNLVIYICVCNRAITQDHNFLKRLIYSAIFIKIDSEVEKVGRNLLPWTDFPPAFY